MTTIKPVDWCAWRHKPIGKPDDRVLRHDVAYHRACLERRRELVGSNDREM